MIKIQINNKKYEVEEAITEKEKQKGLSGKEKFEHGMLFYFDFPLEVSMWMKDTLIPLDIIFIDEDLKVIFVHKGIPMDETPVVVQNTVYVLELEQNSGVKVGDIMEFVDENKQGPVMKVLAPDGSVQMELWGNERIFRRAFTKQLIDLVKKAELYKNDEYKYSLICKRIGRKMFKEIKAQDNRPAEYVKSPK